MNDLPTSRIFGIKSVDLHTYDPVFIQRTLTETMPWENIPRNCHRISTFLTFIAKIKYTTLKCYSCLPRQYASDYYVFVDINDGETCMLISTIRDNHQYPDSALRIPKLREELLFLEIDADILFNLRTKIVDQLHPNE